MWEYSTAVTSRSVFRCTRAGALAAVCAAGLVSPACSQTTTENGGAVAQFEVFDPAANGGLGAWTTSMNALAGQRVEWRVKILYTGTRTDLYAMGEALYQPTIENADNVDAGDGLDTIGPWRNGGNGSNSTPGSMLTQAEGEQGTPLPEGTGPFQGYGRVRFGGTAAAATGSNTMTLFRHSNGSNGAPQGEWMRIAGSGVSIWPPGHCDINPCNNPNLILRGISAQQQSQALSPSFHVPGLSNVTFRQALILSNNPAPRVVKISTFMGAFRRVANITTVDDRFISWQTGPADSGSHRTLNPSIAPATFIVNGPVCDSIDFNRDDLFPDTQDLADFLSVFTGGPCSTNYCADIDFNNDAVFPDIADLASFLSVFSGGPC